jgi:hypothetical protein
VLAASGDWAICAEEYSDLNGVGVDGPKSAHGTYSFCSERVATMLVISLEL